MFTSRAEYRLLLREDNADLRLTEKGYELGLVSAERWQQFCEKRDKIEQTHAALKQTMVRVGLNDQLKQIIETPLQHDCKAQELLKRPEVTYEKMQAITALQLPNMPKEVADQVEVQTKYAGYIERQQMDIERLRKQESTKLPMNFDYCKVSGLSAEIVQKLTHIRPATLGQAGRISGVTPAALSLLLIHLKKYKEPAC